MASCYDKYFSNRDISSAKGKMMFDIKNHVLYGAELLSLVGDLEKNGLLTEKEYNKKPRNYWTDEYTRFLATGFASGYFSRDYIKYCAEVAEYLYQKKKRSKALLAFGVTGLVIVGLIIFFSLL